MLPKPDKSTKKSVKSEQLDLVESISSDTKIKNKRRIVIIALILTIGTSFGLWTYRSLKSLKINFSLPETHPRATSTTIPTGNLDLDSLVAPIISSDPNSWSFYLAVNSQKIWQRNDANFTLDSLKLQPQSPSAAISAVLPSGAQVKEKLITDNSGQFRANYLITIPGSNFFIAVNIIGSNNLNLSKNKLPAVIEKIYWTLVARSN